MNMTHLLRLDRLTVGYGDVVVVHEATFHTTKGDCVALIGPNGCGKSTLLKCLAGLLKPLRGTFQVGWGATSEESVSRSVKVSYLRQTENVFPGLTLDDNLRLGFLNAGTRIEYEGRRNMLLNRFALDRTPLGTRAGALSGGLRQRLALAMILMRRVDFLLLDEPISGLAPDSCQQLLGALDGLRVDEGFGWIMVEHRLQQIQPWTNRVLVMQRGRIVEDTRRADILTDSDHLAEFYLS